MKKNNVVFIIISVILAAGIGVLAFFFVKQNKLINTLSEKNDKLQSFAEKNFDVDMDTWDGEEVALTEKKVVKTIKNAMEEYGGFDTSSLDDVNTISELIEVMADGSFGEEIHEIYDDTAVVAAYRNNDDTGLSDEDRYVLETAKSVIDDVIKDGMTDYEKELAIYNWQFGYVNYDESHFSAIPDNEEENNYTPYGVLKSHQAICVGNATTFKLFMDMLGIDCKIIHSTEEGEHAWNLVCLDGDWYHVDLTFDGGCNGNPDYAYFNVPDSFKLDGGYPWDTSEFPEADGTRYCYIFNHADEVNDIMDVPALVKEKLDNGGGTVYISSSEELDGFEAMVERISDRVLENRNDAYVYSGDDVRDTGDRFIYSICVETDDDDYGDIDDGTISEELEKLIDSMF